MKSQAIVSGVAFVFGLAAFSTASANCIGLGAAGSKSAPSQEAHAVHCWHVHPQLALSGMVDSVSPLSDRMRSRIEAVRNYGSVLRSLNWLHLRPARQSL